MIRKILFALSAIIAGIASWIPFDLSMTEYPFWYWHGDDGMEGMIIIIWAIPLSIVAMALRLWAILPINGIQYLKMLDFYLFFFFIATLFRPIDSLFNRLLVDQHGFTIITTGTLLTSCVFIVIGITDIVKSILKSRIHNIGI